MKYGGSERKIGDLNINKKKIITKIFLPSKKIKNLQKWYSKNLNKSLKDLRVKKLYGLLIHNVSNLKNNKKILDLLLESKRKKKITKIGVSVYDRKEVNNVLKFWKPDIIQFPANIFDQRFLKNNFLKKIKNHNIETYARSCFLQGVLLNKKLKFGNTRSQILFNKFIVWCKKNNISQLNACLHFIKQNKYIDSIIVGFENSIQLKEILLAFNKKEILISSNFENGEKNLIDPRKWRVN